MREKCTRYKLAECCTNIVYGLELLEQYRINYNMRKEELACI